MKLSACPGQLVRARSARLYDQLPTPPPDKPLPAESTGWHSSHPALWDRWIVFDGAIVDIDAPVQLPRIGREARS